jgi:alpha-amylase
MTAPLPHPTFCVLSFEGPDRYALAGGLGVRVDKLTRTLARRGYNTHLLFVGDPSLPGHEERSSNRPARHRWCQWISRHHPAGVYDGENGKVEDFNQSAPLFVVDRIVRPTIAAGGLPVILAEEWHTAEALLRIDEQLRSDGLRDRCVLFWNANNTMSFHRVDWPRLRASVVVTTVSRYMKHLMWGVGVNPVVIPNGIPSTLLAPVDPDHVAAVRQSIDPGGDRLVLFKVGRFDPAKRWIMAVEAAARLKESGNSTCLVMAGGIEAHRFEVLDYARRRCLDVRSVFGESPDFPALLNLLGSTGKADVLDLNCFLGEELIRPLYRAADAVLANSGHEPFGLVALEAMAAGGIAFTGSTGEEYAFTPGAAVPVESDDPDEIVGRVLFHRDNPERARALRRQARIQASAFTWEKTVDVLLEKVAFTARHGGGFGLAGRPSATRFATDLVVYLVVHQPRRLRLPAAALPEGASADVIEERLFDDDMNERYFRKVACSCYRPALERFEHMLDRGMKLAIGFSMSFLDQTLRWDPDLLDRFRRVVQHPHVELVAVEPAHSFIMLWDAERFVVRMRMAADRLEALFGKRPRAADTTELMMSDVIYHALALAGYDVAFIDGRAWVLHDRAPTAVFHSGQPTKLLARHYSLSDDVGYRFSNRSWECWPLMADRYASWLAANPGDVVVLGWDFETFGEHHRADTGIFEFMEALPTVVQRAGMAFRTPAEVVARHGHHATYLPLPAFPSTWAGSGGLEFFLGNPAQQAILQLMMQAHNKARLCGDEPLRELALLLAQSDNLHLVQWYGRSGDEAAVSAYFTPSEWWALGPEGIVWEMQQVYKNFIACMNTPVRSDAQALQEERPPAATSNRARSATRLLGPPPRVAAPTA